MSLAGADTITLDPSAVATNRTALELSGPYSITDIDWGNAQMEQYMAARLYGEVPVGGRMPNRTVTITLNIRADEDTGVGTAVKQLQWKVARFQAEGGSIERQLNPRVAGEWGADVLYGDVVDAQLSLPAGWMAQRQEAILGAQLVLSCLPDFYGAESSAARLVAAIQRVDADNSNLSTLLLADPDASTGTLLDRSANAYTGSLANGATVAADALGPEDALSLTGSAYGSFAAPTLRNPCTNPSIETGTTGYFASGTNTIAASTDQAFAGSQSLKVTYQNTLFSSGRSISAILETSTTFWIQARVYIPTDWDGGAISITDGGEFAGKTVVDATNQSTSTKGSWQWLRWKITTAADITGNLYFQIASAPTAGKFFYVDAVMVSKSTAATCPAYFDGAGYVNDAGVYVANDGRCGWLGTAHASASDKGPLGNGKILTFVGVVQVSADAASSVGQTLFGSDLSTNGTRFDLYNSAGTRQARLQVGGTTYTWTLTADEIAATAAGQTFAYRLEFNETADTATLQINGLPAVQKTSVTAQHAAGQTTVQLGAYASGSSPLPGKVGPGALFVGAALSADEWERIANAVGYSSDDHDSLVLSEPVISGDYPARSRFVFTDKGSQARQAVLIASQSRTYDSAPTARLTYEAEALTPIDAAAVVTKSGAHGGASNNAVHHAAISPSWTGVLSTQHTSLGHLTHWGNYRIIARVYTSATTRARFEYSVGDSATRRVNAAVTVPGDGGFYLCDFGEVRISKPPLGTQQWMGAFFAQADTAGVTFGIDKVWLAPTESLSVCRPRQSSSVGISSLPLSTDARDSFSQTSGNLNAKTADRGGAWSTAGATTDFTIDTTNGRAQRTATSDASQRFGVVGSNVTSCYAAVDIISSVFTTYYWQGLALRYVDTSNWIAAALYYFNSENRLIVVQSVAGVTTTLLEETIAAQAPGGSKRIAATVDPNGRVEVLFDGATYSVVCTAAATGGALASGKVGIVDYHPSATATTRQWDNFVGTSITTDVACLSGKSLSARHDGAWRETSTSGIYAPVFVEGPFPRAPASGLESRLCRTLVLPSAGDLSTIPDADPKAFAVSAAHRPAYLFLPED